MIHENGSENRSHRVLNTARGVKRDVARILGAMRPLTLFVVLVATFAARTAHAQACATPTEALLWNAAPVAQRAGLHLPRAGERALPARVAEVELNGAPPLEAALAFDSLEALPEDNEASEDQEEPTPQTHLWVYACTNGSWAPLAHTEVEISEGWDGTLDVIPGVEVMRRETLANLPRDFIRLEQTDVNGGSDPRYVRRRFMLFHLVRGALIAALDIVVHEFNESGPEREETMSATRRIVLMRGTPARYRLRVEERWVGERPRRCRTILTFDGETFVSADETCS